MLCLGVELSLESCGLDISPLHILPQCGKYSFRPDVLKVLSVDSQCLFRYFQGVCKVKTFHTNTRSFPPTFSLFLTFAKVMMGKPGILTWSQAALVADSNNSHCSLHCCAFAIKKQCRFNLNISLMNL